jgi:exosome complex component RRP4
MEKRIVLPGEKIAEGRLNMQNTYFNGSHTVAAVVGMEDEGRYIPLVSQYHPKIGDMIIGMITGVRHAGYSVDLNLPSEGFISTRNIKIKLEFGDFVVCKVREVTETGDVELSEIRRLPMGKVVDFPPAKIPRLIGRKSSMIEMLKEHVEGDIVVGNNGYVWISEKCNIPLLLRAMKMIEDKAHTSGLTDKVKEFLESGSQ